MLPVVGGITGDAFYDPGQLADGFEIAMVVSAGLLVIGAAIAWLTIDSHILEAERS